MKPIHYTDFWVLAFGEDPYWKSKRPLPSQEETSLRSLNDSLAKCFWEVRGKLLSVAAMMARRTCFSFFHAMELA